MNTPLAIEASPDRLDIRWPDGAAALSAASLRSACRCGRCRAAQPLAIPAGLSLVDVAPAGSYGLQLIFSDGHDRGIYPWPMLRELSASRP